MAATITKAPDGSVNFGNWNGELVTLQPAAADYPTGGYPLIDGVTYVNSGMTAAQNCDMYRIITVLSAGGSGGYKVGFNPTTKTIQVFQGQAGAGPDTEVPANTDLSAYGFRLLLLGL